MGPARRGRVQPPEAAAQQELLAATAVEPEVLTAEQIGHMVSEPGVMTDTLLAAAPERKRPLHEQFGLTLTLDMRKRVVTVESQPSQPCTYGLCPRSEVRVEPYAHAGDAR
ncbi:hypothetical protein GCM10010211_45990 [Streptomyces albospinus]|uniref:Uncharacterized protein n=1 Tax=Streptomyces albospinus TaxID=285515 RepID=A0ABQ2V8X9_9ACTN|nr:hypothetical protein GCM10010211_45990 [Streptomyces albospinus]